MLAVVLLLLLCLVAAYGSHFTYIGRRWYTFNFFFHGSKRDTSIKKHVFYFRGRAYASMEVCVLPAFMGPGGPPAAPAEG